MNLAKQKGGKPMSKSPVLLGNSGGCASEIPVMHPSGQSALVNGRADATLFLVFGLQSGDPAVPAPWVNDPVFITVHGVYLEASRAFRHDAGRRAVEVWRIPPPVPTGAPFVFAVLTGFDRPSYYHAMLVAMADVDGSDPVRADAATAGAGAPSYSTTVQPTTPNDLVLSYLNGEIDGDLGAPVHFCGSGGFFLHLAARAAGPGQTEVAGVASGFGASDWLHVAWAVRP